MGKSSKKKNNEHRKKLLYTNEDLQNALAAVKNGMKVFAAAKSYNIPDQTLRDKISGKSLSERRASGMKSILSSDIEKKLVLWLTQCARQGFAIDKKTLLDNVQKIVQVNNLKTPFTNGRPSDRWFYKFMNRHKELSQKRAEYLNRARGGVTQPAIRRWFKEIVETLGDDADILKDPDRIWNMDESGFQLSPKSNLVIGERGRNVYNESSRSQKESITTLFSVNAMGTFAPPLTIFKYARLPKSITDQAPPFWSLGKSESGWMTSECFFEFISNVFLPYLKEEKAKFPVVVFLDGHSSHLSLELSEFCSSNQIILISLFPNATHILQPLDVAVFGPIKSKWKQICRQWRIENDGREINKADVPLALSRFIGGDPSMQENVISGFKSTGLFPFEPNNVDYSKIVERPVRAEDTITGKIKIVILLNTTA